MLRPLPAYHYKIALSVLLLCAVTFFSSHEEASGAGLVSGRYLSTTGKTLVLSLSIQNPSPSNLIVEQYLSKGNSIIATSPRAIKIDASKHQAKWLFRNPLSGKVSLTIQLEEPLVGGASALIRYRDPQNGGAFTELKISP
ncbi:MAG: hypothetical protein WBB19_18430 [Desulforhopalus sp.]